jgi:hypothetical protein
MGTLKWNHHGRASEPKLLQVLIAKAEMPSGEQQICQATVQLQITQSAGLIRDGQVIGGDLKKLTSPVEWIVVERWIDDPTSTWRIKGKLDVQ